MAVVGAGIAGLACAGRLEKAGLAVALFDKGRYPGGRIATRSVDGASFDHGAQFATARGASLAAALQRWQALGLAAVWPAASTAQAARWVGVPDMAALPRHLAARLTRPPEQSRHVAFLHRQAQGWAVRHACAHQIPPDTVSPGLGRLAGPFDVIILALPAPQAAALLVAAEHPLSEQAAQASYHPCWTLMAAFAAALDRPDVQRPDTGPIAWLAREASRPGRQAAPERFVINATAAWSREHLDWLPQDVQAELLGHAGLSPAICVAHRWRYAQVERALEQPCLWDGDTGVGACGDWCLGGRVEAAWDSGQAMAEAVLAA